MKNKIYLILFIIFTIYSCKINQKINGLKEGKWISVDKSTTDVYKYIEKYKKGIEVKTWKTYKNNKLYKKEVYLKDKCLVTFYNENRKIIAKGQTNTENTEKQLHWFYDGEWKHFDNKGKLIKIKYYYKGVLISEKEIK